MKIQYRLWRLDTLTLCAMLAGSAIAFVACDRIDSHHQIVGGVRSSQWPSVRAKYMADGHDQCAACGTKSDIEVHHVESFSQHAEKELDAKNLITLCRDCHFRIGHDADGLDGPQKPNWRTSNPPTVNENLGNQAIPAMRCRATAGSIFGSPRERFAVFMLRSSARSARVLRNRPQ